MTDTMAVRINTLFADDTFFNRANSVTTSEELLDVLAENGVEMTNEDIEYCVATAADAMIKNGYMTEDFELTEEALELVAGGKSGIGAIVSGGALVYGGMALKGFASSAFLAGGYNAAAYGYVAAVASGLTVVGAALIVAGAACLTFKLLKKYGYL